LNEQYNKLLERLDRMEEKLLTPAELKSRIQDLELWQGKIHSLITEKDKRGNDKLNKIGRELAGKSYNSL
jgi:hypothetical protein